MFKELGQFITRHPIAVIAFWVIVMLLAIPFAMTFEDKLTSSMEVFLPKDLESIQANDLYKTQFPADSNSQLIVAVESDNRTQAMLFIDRLNQSVSNGSIKNITSTTSIYIIQRDALVNVSPELHEGLHDLYVNASDANRELFNATDDVRNASDGVYDLRDNITKINSQLYAAWGQAAGASEQMYSARSGIVSANSGMYQLVGVGDVIFGLPAGYAGAWDAASGAPDDATRKAIAYNNVAGSIPSGPYQALAIGYLQQLNNTWDSTAATSLGSGTYANSLVIGGFASGFISGAPVSDSERQMMQGILDAFPSISAWQDSSTRSNVIVGMALAQGGLTEADRPRLTAIYGLGVYPSGYAVDQLTLSFITAGMSGDAAGQARELYSLGNDKGRIGNYVVSSAQSSTNNTTIKEFIRDAWNLGPQAMDKDFDKYILDRAGRDMNESEKKTLKEIYAWGPKPNESVISGYVLREAGKDKNETERNLIKEIYDLGRNPSNATLANYTVGKVNEELEISGNLSYLFALLYLDRNATDSQVESFARDWSMSHDYTNPQVMPTGVVKNLAAGKLTMYIVSLSDADATVSSQQSVVKTRAYIAGLLEEDQFKGIKAPVTGSSAMNYDTEVGSMDDLNNIDKIAIVLILVLLGLYFRSFFTPLVPLVIIGVAVVIAVGALSIIGTVVPMYFIVMTLMVVIMLGAGTDYCVFLLSRYSEERALGRDQKESIITAVEHSGKSIASSGTTAMIGFFALLIVDRGIFGGFGVGIATGVLFAILVALTLLPAVLTLAGDRLFWPRKVYNTGNRGILKDIWTAITRKVMKHSKIILVLALLVCVPAVYLQSQMSLSSDFVQMMAPGTESKQGFDSINENFGSGSIDRLMILATLPVEAKDSTGNFTGQSLDTIETLSGVIAGFEGVDKVNSATRPDGTTITYANLSSYPMIERTYYKEYMNESLGRDNRTMVLYAVLNGSPYSKESAQTIDDIRVELKNFTAATGIPVKVGGSPASFHDYQASSTSKYGIVYLVVFIGIFLVLAVLLRSVFTPLRLIITLLMSIVWTSAAYVLVFQIGLGYVTTWILPIFLFCALMGLGVDYDIFLVSRVREEVMKGKTDEEAIETAVEATGTIITLCGSVMAAAFGSMLISNSPELQEFGFILFTAIILDATIVRLVLVPAIMVLMKKYNWWMPFIGSEVKDRR